MQSSAIPGACFRFPICCFVSKRERVKCDCTGKAHLLIYLQLRGWLGKTSELILRVRPKTKHLTGAVRAPGRLESWVSKQRGLLTFVGQLNSNSNRNSNWGTSIAPPTRRPRAHHRVNPYHGAYRQNETEMFSDHDGTSRSIAAVSAPS